MKMKHIWHCVPLLLAALVFPGLGCSSLSPLDDSFYQAGEATAPSRVEISELTQLKPEIGQPLFAGQERLDLEALVEAVLKRNPTIASMEHAWRAAASRESQVSSLDDPTFSFGVAPATLTDTGVDDSHKIDLSQKLPWPGKLKLRGQIAAHEAEAAQHDIQTVRDRLIRKARRSYFNYYYVHRAIVINLRNLELLKEFQRIAENKYATGTASKQDALQAEVERYHLEHRVITLDRMKRSARSHINTLLNRDPTIDLPPPPDSVDQPRQKPSLDVLMGRAVNHRSELQALAKRLNARQAARKLAKKQYLPDFTVMGTYNSLWSENEKQFLLGFGLNIPIQTKRRRAAELEAFAKYQQTAAELSARVNDIRFDVADAFDRLTESEHLITLITDKLEPSCRGNLKAALTGYENGKNDFLALLTAEKNLMLIELSYQQALAEYHQRWADLQRAVGGSLIEPIETSPKLDPANP